MKVSLVSVTEPIRDSDKDIRTAEDLIVYTARVSSPENQTNMETAPRLLKYLISHGHFSPFEMADMTVEIETSRAIAAQILRHRSFSFQEFSQRYADATTLGFEWTEPRRQDLKNRQNSTDDLSTEAKEKFAEMIVDAEYRARRNYKAAVELGIAKESARFLLPLNTTTRLYMKGSVRSWIHYLQVRCDKATQLEHREVAEAIKVIFAEQFPSTYEAVFGGEP